MPKQKKAIRYFCKGCTGSPYYSLDKKDVQKHQADSNHSGIGTDLVAAKWVVASQTTPPRAPEVNTTARYMTCKDSFHNSCSFHGSCFAQLAAVYVEWCSLAAVAVTIGGLFKKIRISEQESIPSLNELFLLDKWYVCFCFYFLFMFRSWRCGVRVLWTLNQSKFVCVACAAWANLGSERSWSYTYIW